MLQNCFETVLKLFCILFQPQQDAPVVKRFICLANHSRQPPAGGGTKQNKTPKQPRNVLDTHFLQSNLLVVLPF